MHVNALADEIGMPSLYSGLSQDTIDVWIARVDLSEGALKEWGYILNNEERARQRLYLPSLGCRFAGRRVVLRHVLASYLDIAPEQIRLRYGEQGKPFLDHSTDLQFNLAHTQNTAAISVARRRKLGIDLETLRHDVDFELIAKSFFSMAEVKRLFAGDTDLADNFFRYWTAKESYLKAIGVGLTVPLNSFKVRTELEGRTDRLTIKTRSENRWTCCAWKPFPELCCAVTSEGTDWSIRIQSTQSLEALGFAS